jgi:hypothetical protein
LKFDSAAEVKQKASKQYCCLASVAVVLPIDCYPIESSCGQKAEGTDLLNFHLLECDQDHDKRSGKESLTVLAIRYEATSSRIRVLCSVIVRLIWRRRSDRTDE